MAYFSRGLRPPYPIDCIGILGMGADTCSLTTRSEATRYKRSAVLVGIRPKVISSISNLMIL